MSENIKKELEVAPQGKKKEAKVDSLVEAAVVNEPDLLSSEIAPVVKIQKAKRSKNIVTGICHILATFNNTKICFTDLKGNVFSWSSSGKNGFRGSKKSTAYAAQIACQKAAEVAMSHGLKDVIVNVKGPGMGRDSSIRALQSLGLNISEINDVTPVPHNGCRPRKKRRV